MPLRRAYLVCRCDEKHIEMETFNIHSCSCLQSTHAHNATQTLSQYDLIQAQTNYLRGSSSGSIFNFTSLSCAPFVSSLTRYKLIPITCNASKIFPCQKSRLERWSTTTKRKMLFTECHSLMIHIVEIDKYSCDHAKVANHTIYTRMEFSMQATHSRIENCLILIHS